MRSIKHTPKRNAIERKLHSAIRNTRGANLIVGIFSRGDITSKLGADCCGLNERVQAINAQRNGVDWKVSLLAFTNFHANK